MAPSELNTLADTKGEQDLVPIEPSYPCWGREWLRNLMLKHAHNHPNMPQDLREKALVVVRNRFGSFGFG